MVKKMFLVALLFTSVLPAVSIHVPVHAAEAETEAAPAADGTAQEEAAAADGNLTAAEASAEETTEDWAEEEVTQTFYVPKSRFQSSAAYEEYCQRMYNNGYMDEDYNWTPEAQEYIDSPTEENAETLDEAARALVEERIADGRMEAEDSAFLTYDERQAIIAAKEAAATETTGSGPSESESMAETATEGTADVTSVDEGGAKETSGETDTEETTAAAAEDTGGYTLASFLTKFLLSAAIAGAAMAIYYFYTKKNK